MVELFRQVETASIQASDYTEKQPEVWVHAQAHKDRTGESALDSMFKDQNADMKGRFANLKDKDDERARELRNKMVDDAKRTTEYDEAEELFQDADADFDDWVTDNAETLFSADSKTASEVEDDKATITGPVTRRIRPVKGSAADVCQR